MTNLPLATSFLQSESFIYVLYIIAFALFIQGLRGLSGPTGAVRGNRIAAVGMGIAVIATLLNPGEGNWGLIALGMALGVAVGVLLGLVTGLSGIGEAVLDPILQALRSVPLLGLIPLFIVWFGIGELPKVLFVVLSSLFPMYISTFAGIRGVDSRLGELGHVLGLRRSEMIRHIVLPGALPAALTGLQLSVVFSLIALVVGEQINATSGLGFMITQAEQFLDNSVIMVALIVYAILGLLANGAVRLLERKALAWRHDFGE